MAAIGNGRHGIEWKIIKVVRLPPINGKATGVQIRQGLTDSGKLTFSYVPGVIIYDKFDDSKERWMPYDFIPDRFAFDYMKLFDEAIHRVRSAMRTAASEDGMITPESLQAAIVREIQRRR